MVRSTREFDWTPYPGHPEAVLRVRWYEVPEDRPVVPWTIYRSSDWDEWFDPLTPGERAETGQWREPGPPLREPIGTPGLCGSLALWSGALPYPPVAAPVNPVTGDPLCCGPSVARHPAGTVWGANDLRASASADRAGDVWGAWDELAITDTAGTVWGAWDDLAITDTAGTVWGAEDEVDECDHNCPDLLALYPGVAHGGCTGGGPPERWLVPAFHGAPLTMQLGLWQNRVIYLPLPMPRASTLNAAVFQWGSFPFPGGTAQARAAIYHPRNDRCGYPGALLADLGYVDLTSPGNKSFPLAAGTVMPQHELLWLAFWVGCTGYGSQISTAGLSGWGAFPVLQFGPQSWTRPACAWLRDAPYVAWGMGDWPDPVPADGRLLGDDGYTQPDRSPCTIPALWLSLS